jgi:hypothetical protein
MYGLAHVIVNAPINILLHLALHVLFIICETLQTMERSTNTLFVFCKNIFKKRVQLSPNSIERFWSALDNSQIQKDVSTQLPFFFTQVTFIFILLIFTGESSYK